MVTCGRGLAFRRLLSCLVLALLTTASYFGPSCGYSLDFPSDDDVMVDVIAQRSLSRRSSTTILAQDELVLVEPGSGASADEGDEGHEDVRCAYVVIHGRAHALRALRRLDPASEVALRARSKRRGAGRLAVVTRWRGAVCSVRA